MTFEIKPIEAKETWEAFLQQEKPKTFLQSWNWGVFNERMGEKVFRFGLFADGRLDGLFFIIKIKAKRGSFLFCPHGPILSQGIDQYQAMEAIVRHLKSIAEQVNCSFIRFSPLAKDELENRKVFSDLGFREAPIHMHPELAWILDLTPSEEDLIKNMRKTTRYSIRKAESSGVEVEISDRVEDVERFHKVYRSTVDRQHFTPFSLDYLKTEFETFAADDQVRLIFGKYQGEDISAAMVIYCGGSGFYHQGASNQKLPQIPASYLVQWRAIQEAKRRGCREYNFWGIAPDDQPKHPWAGLSLFKKGFGGSAESYVHAKDLVLSGSYWLTYLIERVRKAKRRL